MERKKGRNRKRNRATVDVDSNIISDKSVNNMNNNGRNSAGGTRKPFTDLVNFNLISPQTICKLCSNTSSASEVQSIRLKSKDQNSPSPQLPTNSKPQTVSDSDSRSATNISPSNFNSAPNTLLDPYLTGKKGNISSPSRAIENLKGRKKNDVSLHTSTSSQVTKKQEKAIPVLTSSEKAKDRQKAIAVPFNSTPTGIVTDKEKGIFANFSSFTVETTSEKAKDKGEAIDVPFEYTPTGIVTDKGKGISVNLSSPTVETAFEKAKDKGKTIVVPFDATPTEILTDKGKGISVNFSPSNAETTSEKANDKRDPIAGRFGSSPTWIALTCPLRLQETRNIRNRPKQDEEINASTLSTDPRGKVKKKKKSVHEHEEHMSLIKEHEEEMRKMKAYFAKIDAEQLVVEEISSYDSEY